MKLYETSQFWSVISYEDSHGVSHGISHGVSYGISFGVSHWVSHGVGRGVIHGFGSTWVQLKKTGKCGNFSQVRDPSPSPQFGNPMFVGEKIMVYFAF